VRKHSPCGHSRRRCSSSSRWAGDDEGRGAYLSASQIAAAIGSHRNTVDRAIAKLESDGNIIRHRGGRDHCDACKRAPLRVRVYDVVLPALPEDENPNQIGLFESHHEAPVRLHQMVQSTEGPLHHHGAIDCTATVQSNRSSRTGLQQLGNAREFSNELVETVERVIESLSRTRLFVDRLAIEAAVMHSTPDAIDAALPGVIALATDPAYTPPKGGAAKVLAIELRNQASRPVGLFPSRPRRGQRAPEPDDFSKYDIAAGLAS
jgi:hypothetical protein